MADIKAFAEQLVNLTVKEVSELKQILKDEYGIEPAAAAVAVAAGPAAAAEAAEEKSSFDVVLKSAGANKLAVVKAVKPVLPPAATPEPDSTKVVTVDVPNKAPVQVAIESDFIIPS